MALHHQPLDAAVPEACRGGAITIGNFDGVHLGHQALVAETIRQARRLKIPALAVTFDPHPQQLLRPDSFQPVLTTLAYRGELLQEHGLDHVLVLQITPAFLQLLAQEFFERIVCRGLQAKAIVEGFNFGFGRGREGNSTLLQQMGQRAGVEVTMLPALEIEGKPIATSRIRTELLAGNVSFAAKLLGRPYRLQGVVGAGQKRGHKLGFPTANLSEIATLIPGNGVYAVQAHHRGTIWPAAANVGPNPTFGEETRKVEIHLIGFEGDLYDQVIAVDFVERIRDTRPFASAAELVAQLQKDVDRARNLLSTR
jgi:riboflavin kinase/FMN adenylyltransferase